MKHKFLTSVIVSLTLVSLTNCGRSPSANLFGLDPKFPADFSKLPNDHKTLIILIPPQPTEFKSGLLQFQKIRTNVGCLRFKRSVENKDLETVTFEIDTRIVLTCEILDITLSLINSTRNGDSITNVSQSVKHRDLWHQPENGLKGIVTYSLAEVLKSTSF